MMAAYADALRRAAGSSGSSEQRLASVSAALHVALEGFRRSVPPAQVQLATVVAQHIELLHVAAIREAGSPRAVSVGADRQQL